MPNILLGDETYEPDHCNFGEKWREVLPRLNQEYWDFREVLLYGKGGLVVVDLGKTFDGLFDLRLGDAEEVFDRMVEQLIQELDLADIEYNLTQDDYVFACWKS